MSILSDATITVMSEGQSNPLLSPFNIEQVNPSSYDLTLGNKFLLQVTAGQGNRNKTGATCDVYSVYSELPSESTPIDFANKNTFISWNEVVSTLDFTLYPGEFALAHTQEVITLPNWVQGKVDGKSSRARNGLVVENAGIVDPGFKGQITLELYNLCSRPILLRPGLRIAQITFNTLDHGANRPYGYPDLGSHYQGQMGPTPARS